ncbi:MAG: YcxB family protein, partial [Lachnospiraceae bacterium]|nr:YcxB family protein [Lachnospiraceae bacterium]
NNSGIFLLLIAAVYFIVQPLMLYLKASQQAKNEVFMNDTYYAFDEDGVAVWQEGVEPSVLQWQNVRKFVKFGKNYFLYVDAAHGNIIPASSIEGNPSKLDELIVRVLPKEKRRGFRG